MTLRVTIKAEQCPYAAVVTRRSSQNQLPLEPPRVVEPGTSHEFTIWGDIELVVTEQPAAKTNEPPTAA